MSCNPDMAIVVDNISKCYEMYARPFHRLLQTLCRGKRNFYEEFRALHNISFSIKRGECIGIIGRNGAGKSTLLQIITGLLQPSTGSVKVQGRVTALLELGSGFSPDYTGRENIYLNGTILGLSRQDIDEKINDIIEFADIGKFIDQPVKTYSSGMMVRLAFAVQTQVQPDILIVDEALSVGDAAFQMKCMARMNHLIESGVTVIFVSHSIQTVRSFCTRTIWLDAGKMREVGPTAIITSQYMEHLFMSDNVGKQNSPKEKQQHELGLIPIDEVRRLEPLRRWGDGNAQILSMIFSGSKGTFVNCVEHLEPLKLRFTFKINGAPPVDEVTAAFSLRDTRGIDIVAVSSENQGIRYDISGLEQNQIITSEFTFNNVLVPGEYMLILAVEYMLDGEKQYCDYIENALLFTVVSEQKHYGLVEPEVSITIK